MTNLNTFLLLTIFPLVMSCHFDEECTKYEPKMESLPITKDAISQHCRVYRQYQACVNTYAEKCLSGINQNQFYEMIDKAIGFAKTLCLNSTFQTDYTNEFKSFELIADDWRKCQNASATAARDIEKNPKNNTIYSICCVTDELDNCIEKLCEKKCTEKGKNVYGDILKFTKHASDVLQCDSIPEYKSTCENSAVKFTINNIILMVTTVSVFRILF